MHFRIALYNGHFVLAFSYYNTSDIAEEMDDHELMRKEFLVMVAANNNTPAPNASGNLVEEKVTESKRFLGRSERERAGASELPDPPTWAP